MKNAGIDLRIGQVTQIDRNNRVALLANGDHISCERLILSTGSGPIIPPIPGRDLEGVFTIHKNYSHQDRLFRKVMPTISRMVIIGGGFIGVEFAEEIRKRGVEVHIVEKMPDFQATTFDREIYLPVQQYLQGKGIHIHCQRTVEAILPDENDRVTGVRLQGDETIDADGVLMAIGVRPK